MRRKEEKGRRWAAAASRWLPPSGGGPARPRVGQELRLWKPALALLLP